MKKFELSIPKPCHEDWQRMTPEDKGRFCAACQKTVVDFSTMSDQQIAAFFKKPVDSVCGRFSDHQLNRVIAEQRKPLPWIRYFFTIALPAFLWSVKGSAQGEVKVTRKLGRVAVCEKSQTDTLKAPVEKPAKPLVFKGRIVDEKGAGIPHASVVFKGTQTGVSADEEGRFELRRIDPQYKELWVTCIGYETAVIQISDTSFRIITLRAKVMDYLGVVVITERKKSKPIPIIETLKKDSSQARFAVYPNPAPSGSTVYLDVNNLEKGLYEMAILSSDGEYVQASELNVEANKRKLSIALSSVTAGSYFIRLTNRKTSKSYTEIIIVQ